MMEIGINNIWIKNMYKSFKISKTIEIALNKFPKTAKEVSKVYSSGLHLWKSDIDYTFSLVVGLFRVMFYFKRKDVGEVCSG